MPHNPIDIEIGHIAELQTRIDNATDTIQMEWLENHLSIHVDKLNYAIDCMIDSLLFGTKVYATCHPIFPDFTA